MNKISNILRTALMIGVLTLVCMPLATYAQGLPNPIGGGTGTTDIRVIVGVILKGVLGLTGTVALIVFIYGGFQWMLARGESGEVKKGLDTMLWAGLGLVVIFGSYAILDRVFQIIPK